MSVAQGSNVNQNLAAHENLQGKANLPEEIFVCNKVFLLWKNSAEISSTSSRPPRPTRIRSVGLSVALRTPFIILRDIRTWFGVQSAKTKDCLFGN